MGIIISTLQIKKTEAPQWINFEKYMPELGFESHLYCSIVYAFLTLDVITGKRKSENNVICE